MCSKTKDLQYNVNSTGVSYNLSWDQTWQYSS